MSSRRITGFLFGVFIAAGVGLFLFAQDCLAEFDWDGGGRTPHKLNLDVSLEGRYFSQYVRAKTITTPPDSYLGELQVAIPFKNFSLLQVLGGYAHSVSGAPAQTFALGIKMPIATIQGYSGVISYMQFWTEAQGLYYDYTTGPTPPDIWMSSGFAVRYGGALTIKYGGAKRFGTILGCDFGRVSENFYIMPHAGVLYTF